MGGGLDTHEGKGAGCRGDEHIVEYSRKACMKWDNPRMLGDVTGSLMQVGIFYLCAGQ